MTEEKMEKLFNWWRRMPQSKQRADEIKCDTKKENANDK